MKRIAVVLGLFGAEVGMGCSGAPCPENGSGYEVPLTPGTGFDGDTVLYVDEISRTDELTDCIRLKATFDSQFKEQTATFEVQAPGTPGGNYGDNPVLANSCDPEDNPGATATIDDNGIAYRSATWWAGWWLELPVHYPSDYFHPADSFGCKATTDGSQPAYSHWVVFWKEIHFEVDYLLHILWLFNPEVPWDRDVTRNLLFSYKTYPPDDPETPEDERRFAPESDTTCYNILEEDVEISSGIFIDLNNSNSWPSWYPIPDYETEDFFIETANLMDMHRDHKLDTVYLLMADYCEGWNPNPDGRYCGGLSVYDPITLDPIMMYVFADPIKTKLAPATYEEYSMMMGMFTAHELDHYLTGNELGYDEQNPHPVECIMWDGELNYLWDPLHYGDSYLCSVCTEVMKSYLGEGKIPLRIKPIENPRETVK